MDIKILGTGCPKCKEVEKRVADALAELGVAANVKKVTAINKIMEYKVFVTPGLVIDGRVVSAGKLPSHEEIKTWIREAGS